MDLPEEEFKKLEIVPPVIQIVKNDENLAINLNPFYKEDRKQNCENVTNKLFGPKCSYCDNNKTEEYSSSSTRKRNSNLLEHCIINPAQFKQKNKQIRKVLKEPILKDIGKCVHQNNIKNRKLSKLENTTNKSDDEKLFGSSQNQDNLDFKTLAIEYSGMSLSSQSSSTCSSSSDIPNSTGSSFTKNFNNNSLLKSKNQKEFNKNLEDTTKSLNQQPDSSIARSSSCSQQARIVNVGCDITIDELAGYFETFVHIPKKMSSMAAEMYM